MDKKRLNREALCELLIKRKAARSQLFTKIKVRIIFNLELSSNILPVSSPQLGRFAFIGLGSRIVRELSLVVQPNHVSPHMTVHPIYYFSNFTSLNLPDLT